MINAVHTVRLSTSSVAKNGSRHQVYVIVDAFSLPNRQRNAGRVYRVSARARARAPILCSILLHAKMKTMLPIVRLSSRQNWSTAADAISFHILHLGSH